MNEQVVVRCASCERTKEVNYIDGILFGWPRCCCHKPMTLAVPVSQELKAKAKSVAMLPTEERSSIGITADGPPVDNARWRRKCRSL